MSGTPGNAEAAPPDLEEEALLSTIEVGGDCDTNAAIVGGVVAAFTGSEGIPEDWRLAREGLALKK